MQVWATYKNADMTEGKGPMVMDKVFLERKDADEYLLQQEGVFGRRPSPELGWQGMGDWKVEPLFIMEHLQDGVDYERARLLERAYSKLTDAEKKAIVEHVTANVT